MAFQFGLYHVVVALNVQRSIGLAYFIKDALAPGGLQYKFNEDDGQKFRKEFLEVPEIALRCGSH